jgi:lipopolysaccharide heptosyltransferase II
MNRLVILAPNWLGDAVMALPAVADVRRHAPSASITVAARPSIAPLFTIVAEVDEVAGVAGVAGVIDVVDVERLQREFDTALLLPNSFRSALLVARAGIPNRWGYRTQWRAPLLTKSVEPPREVHQSEYYQRLVRALGFANGPAEPTITVPAAVRDNGARLLAECGCDLGRPIVALAPGAAYGGAKRWPPEYFAELVSTFAADGIQTVMVGSPADGATADLVARAGSPERFALQSLVGKTDLPTLAGVLANCRALVTNDSGAMHLAAAVGTPVTAVFGPTNERATFPRGDAHRVLTNPVWCRPCMLRECPLDHRCMRGVAPQRVLTEARRSL